MGIWVYMFVLQKTYLHSYKGSLCELGLPVARGSTIMGVSITCISIKHQPCCISP